MEGSKKSLKIDIWEGDWGLPSVDLQCLRIMAYCRFAGYDLKLSLKNNPFWTPQSSLPVLHIQNFRLNTLEDLQKHLENTNVCPDRLFSSKQRAEMKAYNSLLEEKLWPALQYAWWVDERNFNGFSRPWYARALPFPFNFYYPGKFRGTANDMVAALFDGMPHPTDRQAKLYGEAEKCLTALSVRLGESEFMFGARPSSLDATLYGYLAPLAKAPLPNNALQNHLIGCPNLMKLISTITRRYFAKEAKEFEEKKRLEAEKQKAADSSDPEFKLRNQIFLGIVAAAAMCSYALSTGIIQSPRSSTDHQDLFDSADDDSFEDT